MYHDAMKIAPGAVVAFDFTLSDDDGEVIDQGEMVYLDGHEQILPGLERALAGREPGEKVEVTLAPAEAYGESQDLEDIRVPRGELPAELDLEPGAELQAHAPDGTVDTFWVVAVEPGWVTLTREHPLAGITLHFDVTVTRVRSATPAELEHGHAHEGEPHP
jgi:FKBP-type peptidyl-prolyl cis-trans isomerase SlyD